MSYYEIMGLVGLATVVWLWFDSLAAREAGIRAVRSACRAGSLQLLDDTVAVQSASLARNERGTLVLRRIYEFEYSDTGDNRLRGTVHLLGLKVTMVDVGVLLLPQARAHCDD